ncbi:glycerophosphoryl diester phosphodiesterase [Alkalispirochaeta americana]|uniref:Glycerophosphoryl diester phosphodiesterase n=1 Tax=Alkalispirochaeta americana TaxID=159291 RepID=A0A1N6R8Q1_9SPIO|nr:glycerophosphodiester phosphodiesterase [Alkalispirochaeta americana]SIQ25214.1 glycerophosphoryl diester phosphodiesterase [Alkalispirochaeta americana]
MKYSQRVLVTAHTGCENTRANTAESFLAGIEAGADLIEVDIRSSRDGIPVLHHDEELTNSRGDRRSIADCTYEEARAFMADEPELLPSLEEIFSLAKGKSCLVNLDLKDPGSLGYIRRLLSSWSLEDGVVFTGCNAEWARMITGEFPRLQVMLNASELQDIPLAMEDYEAYARLTCRSAREAGCCGINLHHRLCQPFLVDYAHRRFLPVSVWTVNDKETMEDLIGQGVSSITTMEPRKLMGLQGLLPEQEGCASAAIRSV